MIDDALQSRLLARATRMLGCREDAEEAMQETLIALWLHPPQELNVQRVLGNKCRDTLRRRLTHPNCLPAIDSFDLVFADPRPSVAWQVETAMLVEDALPRMLPVYRDALLLLALGWSWTEAADRLGVPAGTVKSRVHRGRASLRALL